MKNVETPVEAERYALDLYGGKEAVLERMDSLIRKELSLISKRHKEHIYAELRENGAERFIEVLKGRKKIDFETFDMLKDSYFDVSIHDALGELDLISPDDERYWKRQMRENPMLISLDKPNIGKKKLEELELHLYISYKAIAELAQAA